MSAGVAVGVRVRFLGSGDAFGSGGRFQTCIHVEAAGAQVLLDCGASSLVAMRRFGVDPLAIDAVVLSHLHGDHFGGVPFLLLDGQFKRRTRPLTVAGPPGVEARVRAAMEVLFPGSTAVERRFVTHFVELVDRAPHALGPFTLTPFPVVHASGAPLACTTGNGVRVNGPSAWGARSTSSTKWVTNRRSTAVEPGKSTSIAARTRASTPGGPATVSGRVRRLN